MTTQAVRLEIQRRVATVTLNRPAVLNAFDVDAGRALNDALERVRAERGVRAVVLTGAPPAFCAGADLRQVREQADLPWYMRQLTAVGHQAIAALKALPQPTIAAVNGVAAGGGWGLALACDLALAGTSATFTTAFLKLGLSPDYGTSHHLVRLLGEKKAFELAAFSPVLGAEEAHALGLLNRIVPDAELVEAAAAWADALADGPPLALARAKRLIQRSGDRPLLAQLEAESLAIVAAGNSRDFAEGVAAFLEKRPPTFRGE